MNYRRTSGLRKTAQSNVTTKSNNDRERKAISNNQSVTVSFSNLSVRQHWSVEPVLHLSAVLQDLVVYSSLNCNSVCVLRDQSSLEYCQSLTSNTDHRIAPSKESQASSSSQLVAFSCPVSARGRNTQKQALLCWEDYACETDALMDPGVFCWCRQSRQ